MIKYLQLPFSFDAGRMQQEVNSIAEGPWQLHYQKLHYEGNWSAVPLRSIDGKADDILISPFENPVYADTVFLDNAPYLKEVLSFFKCPLQAVRLMKLEAGAKIKEHRDAELYFEKGFIRIHIPVITNEKVEFILDREKMVLKEGECWYMNFNLPHALQNKSDKDRIHLVLDAEVNDWVKELFTSPAITIKKEVSEHALYGDAEKQKIIDSLRSMNTETGNRLADEMEGSS